MNAPQHTTDHRPRWLRLARSAAAALTALVVAFGATPALAQDAPTPNVPTKTKTAPQAGEEVTVEIRTIYVTTDAKGIDARLEHLKPKLTKAFPNYGTFKELARHEATLQRDAAFEFSIPGGTHLILSNKGLHVEEGKELIHLSMNVDRKFRSDVRASRGSTFFQAGLPHGSGILVLAITLR